jgi:hypothetical protein
LKPAEGAQFVAENWSVASGGATDAIKKTCC